jgi:hypothetical protein
MHGGFAGTVSVTHVGLMSHDDNAASRALWDSFLVMGVAGHSMASSHMQNKKPAQLL